MIGCSILLALVLTLAQQAQAQHDWVIDDPDVPGVFVVETSERLDLDWWQRTLNENDWLRDGVGATFEFERSVAVVVAIGDYVHWPQLTSPAIDAECMTDFLLHSAGFDEVYTLTDREVTRDRIDELARRLRGRVGQNGRFLFYWSGHGGLLPGSQGVGFLPLPVASLDGSHIPGEPESGQFVVMSELPTLAQRIGGRHQLYMLDACFSGSVLGEPRTSAGAVNLLSQPTIQLLTSSANDERSYGAPTSDRTGHVAGGFLPTAFLNAVGYGEVPAADHDGNGLVTASEIEVSVVKELLGISAARAVSQRPDLQPMGRGSGDFFFMSKATFNGTDLPPLPSGDATVSRGAVQAPSVLEPESTPPHLLDGLANLIRPRDSDAIAIRKSASEAVRRRNATLRGRLTGIGDAAGEALLRAATHKMLVRLDPRAEDPEFVIPQPPVSEFNVFINDKDYSDAVPALREFLNKCPDPESGMLLPFARTVMELNVAYKTAISWMYGASEPVYEFSWERAFSPTAGLGERTSIRDEGRNELALDALLEQGFLTRNYDIL